MQTRLPRRVVTWIVLFSEIHHLNFFSRVVVPPPPINMSNTEGEPDVNDFLQRIKELGNKRDQEDEDRTRKLEEEILQGRKERQARRAGN